MKRVKPMTVRPAVDYPGRWVVRCRECPPGREFPVRVVNDAAPPFGARLTFPSLGAAHDGAVAHFRREHWTPEVVQP